MNIRTLADTDYSPAVEIWNRSFPDDPWTVEEARHRHASWDHARFAFVSLVAEDFDGRVAAYGRYNHMPWEFDTQKYMITLVVDPEVRRRGIGSALLMRMLDELRQRGGARARSWVAKETMTESVTFLAHRGFAEVQRGYESRLDVPRFDFSRFEGAEDRVFRQGISLTTLAQEGAGDPDVLRAVYELTQACARDVPSPGEITTVPFETWLSNDIETPKALPEAFFLAKDRHRYIGLSFMQRRLGQPSVLQQELTGMLRAYRDRGIAMALKLRTVKYARAHGYGEIRTGNDARNRPMLHINEALGFEKQPAWLVLEKPLNASR